MTPSPIRPAPYHPERDRECEPTYRLDEYIDSLRLGDPVKWARLQAQWSDPVGRDLQLISGDR